MRNTPIVEIRNLKKKYDEQSPYILKDINFSVYPGEIIGYIGPNGAGKSTTIKCILGIIDNYEGSIFIKGKNIKSDPIEYKRLIGYVSETGDVYDMLTGAEYIQFLGKIYGLSQEDAYDKGLNLMKVFNIEDYYNNKISSYSKGMKQKLLIISALFHNPDIIFLDEPLNGMDANSILIFKEILKRLSEQGKTIFYSSHIMEVVEKISDRILLINNGVIESDSTVEELKTMNLESSLENIFNKMTGFNEQETLADEFMKTISGSDSNAV